MKIRVYKNGLDIEMYLNNFISQILVDHDIIKIEHTNDFTFIHYKERPEEFPPTINHLEAYLNRKE